MLPDLFLVVSYNDTLGMDWGEFRSQYNLRYVLGETYFLQ